MKRKAAEEKMTSKGPTIDAELGYQVLWNLLNHRKTLREAKESLREFNALHFDQTNPRTSLARDKVQTSPEYGRMEKDAVSRLMVQEEMTRLRDNLSEERKKLKEAIANLPESLARDLRLLIASTPDRDRLPNPAERKAGKLYEALWNACETVEGRENPITQAKQCRMWKRYYDERLAQKKMTQAEANHGFMQRTGVSMRTGMRKIRLLRLIPELQSRLVLGILGETIGYELSFLRPIYQERLCEIMRHHYNSPTQKEAHALRKFTFEDWFHSTKVEDMLR